MIPQEILIAGLIAAGVILLVALDRVGTRADKNHSRSNARVVHEVKRIAVREPERIIESVE